jgi:hypothetical protein
MLRKTSEFGGVPQPSGTSRFRASEIRFSLENRISVPASIACQNSDVEENIGIRWRASSCRHVPVQRCPKSDFFLKIGISVPVFIACQNCEVEENTGIRAGCCAPAVKVRPAMAV